MEAREHESLGKTLSYAARARQAVQGKIAAQVLPDDPPDWLRGYAQDYPPPCSLDHAWSLATAPDERDHDLELWWMLAYLSTQLTVPAGTLRGQPLQWHQFQRELVLEAFAPGVHEFTFTSGRKNAKSSSIGAILSYYLSRFGARRAYRALAVSKGGTQCAQLWSATDQIMEASGLYDVVDETDGKPLIKRLSTKPGAFKNRALGTEVKMLNSSRASGVGSDADLVLLDELGEFDESAETLLRNMETSRSAREGSRTIAISVESVCNSFLEQRYERTKLNPDRYKYRRYAAPEACALDDREAWAAANPGLAAGIKSYEYMESESFKAMHDPSLQASFRSLELNQQVPSAGDLIFTADEWLRCEVDELPAARGPAFLGVDLGGATSFSAAAVYWPESGRLEGLLAIGKEPDLAQRGRDDSVGNRYELMSASGFLLVCPAALVEHRWFLARVRARFGDPSCAVSDNYRRHELNAAILAEGLPWRVQLRRQGSGPDGGTDIRLTQRAVIRREIAVLPNLAWVSALMECKLKHSETTNWPGLAKRRRTARIDLVSALVLAVGEGQRWKDEREAAAADSSPVCETMPW